LPEKTTGFASPAQGYEEEGIDLNRLLIRNPPATIYVRLDSSDIEALGLARGTLLVIDRSIVPVANNLVMIRHEGQFLCRLLIGGAWFLTPFCTIELLSTIVYYL